MTALFLGSISTLADTSETQRNAFNAAFAAHGLDWNWDRDTYQAMLATAGGRNRIAAYAGERGVAVDADAVHATKSQLFQERLAETGAQARAGVVDTIGAVRSDGGPVALVTTTSRANVDALLTALAGQVSASDFDVVITADDVTQAKPHPAAYELALSRLGVAAADGIAVEDNVDGVAAAVAAGLRCVAFPNGNTAGHDFSAAVSVADHLDATVLA